MPPRGSESRRKAPQSDTSSQNQLSLLLPSALVTLNASKPQTSAQPGEREASIKLCATGPRRSSRIANSRSKATTSNIAGYTSAKTAPARLQRKQSRISGPQGASRAEQANRKHSVTPSATQHQISTAQTKVQAVSTKNLLSIEPQSSTASRIEPWRQAVLPGEPVHIRKAPQEYIAMSSSAVGNMSAPPTDAARSENTARQKGQRASASASLKSQLGPRHIRMQQLERKDRVTLLLEKSMAHQKGLSEDEFKQIRHLFSTFAETGDDATLDAERYDYVEAFRQRFNEKLPDFRLFTITAKDFEKDQNHCLTCQEAFLQRTVLLSVMDRWRISNKFVVDCETVWQVSPLYSLPDARHIPASEKHTLSKPKPDLAVFFSHREFYGLEDQQYEFMDHIDPSLLTCIHPDGNGYRCFPFLFMEAKKGSDTLDQASMVCLHEASQALYNIWSCMKEAGNTGDIEKIRVFSIALNAKHFEVRIHFAKKALVDDNLIFNHNVLSPGVYDRDNLSSIIRTILNDYAAKELLTTLKVTVQTLLLNKATELLGRERAKEVFREKRLVGASEAAISGDGATEVNEGDEEEEPEVQHQVQGGTRRSRTTDEQQKPSRNKRAKRSGQAGASTTIQSTGQSFRAGNLSLNGE